MDACVCKYTIDRIEKYILHVGFIFFALSVNSHLSAQADCDNTYAKIFGSLIDNEKGYTIAVSESENIFYLGGFRNDSVIILKVDPSGEIVWTRTFDFIPGRADHLRGFIVDSEGMIVGSGGPEAPQQGTSVFAFRYNPNANSMLWSQNYRSSFNNLANSIQEILPGGDFLMSNNPHTTTPNDVELLKLDRNTGQIIPDFSKHYHLGGSETLGDISYHEGYLYAAGRFTDGQPISKMRNTLIKLDPNSGQPVWVLMGHKPQSATARLYGVDHVIYEDTLYSVSLGDPNGASINITQVFIQKTTLEGSLVWIKQYDLPGSNDWVDEIIISDGGLVILGHNRSPPSDMILFKINTNGSVLWSKRFDFSDNDNSVNLGNTQSQLVELNGHLYFTAETERAGKSDMLLIKTNLLGEIGDTCFGTSNVTIPVLPVANPFFYNPQITVTTFIPQAIPLSISGGIISNILASQICSHRDTVYSAIERTICEGQQFEGYSTSGQFLDYFVTSAGCDSQRIIELTVLPSAITALTQEICFGDTLEGYFSAGTYIDTFVTILGCDSIRILELNVVDEVHFQIHKVICPDSDFEGYSQSGIYTDTFPSFAGCDSIRVLTLLMEYPQISFVQEICSGQQYFGYSLPGVYMDTLVGNFGDCDTVRSLQLTVRPPLQSSFSVVLCDGEQYDGYTLEGVYMDSLTTPDGCDSIRVLTLFLENPEISFVQEICSGQHYFGYELPGIYMDTLVGNFGDCDTIRSLQLTVRPPIQSSFSMVLCDGEQYDGYTLEGVYTDSLTTADGCDSIRTVNITLASTTSSIVEASICEMIHNEYSHPGIYLDTLLSVNGCDSIRTSIIRGAHIYIPNVFSPNGDDINDLFEIVIYPDIAIELTSFSIYDRFGNKVFETAQWPVQWNGSYKSGQMANPGVFTYRLQYLCHEKQVLQHGNITLLR